MQISMEFMKNGAAAKKISPYPLLDKNLFEELTTAMFKESLGLTDEQLTSLVKDGSNLIDELVGEVPVEELAPLDRFQIQMAISSGLQENLDRSLCLQLIQ